MNPPNFLVLAGPDLARGLLMLFAAVLAAAEGEAVA